MSNCHDLFQHFYDQIELSASKKEYLKKAREAIRDRIGKYFRETMKTKIPEFRIQGSYSMATIVNPLDGEFDIDDGVYLQNLDPDKGEWPAPATVHNWIYKAVEGHTDEKPKDKRTCVRVIYSGNYHVDLPIYGTYDVETYLAEKGDLDWHVSDPEAITSWFINEVKKKGEQLRRIVRYSKAWTDYNSKHGKLPSGFVITVLVADGYEKSQRDDSSFGGTIRNIYNRICYSSEILNPVDTSENLTEHITEAQIDNFKARLSSLLDNASAALKEQSKAEACKRWKREFGDRFPKCEDLEEEETPLKTSSPAILKDDARSA